MKNTKSYTICSSSNLLTTNSHWKKLATNYELEFTTFGDFITPLHAKRNNGIIIILFFEDLILNSDIELNLLKKKYTSFFKMLENQANLIDQPIIISWSKFKNQNIINGVRENNVKQNFCDWFSEQLTALKRNLKNIYLINLDDIFYSSGSNETFSRRNWYFARCRLSQTGLNILINSLSKVLHKINNASSKVFVLDCDNTLWGGVIGEVGIEGIVLGQDGIGNAFVDFQREILNLYNEGVLIALASKNNEEEVWNVFNSHNEMLLKKDHIVTSRINWKEKAANVAEMAEELDLGLDSFVFWDDNPLERNKMKTILPEVKTLDIPSNVIYWPSLLCANDDFAKFNITDEDKNKSDQYKSRARFKNNLKNTNDLKSYLKSLNLSPKIVSINDSNIKRAEQLCMKTNQFNISTKRHLSSDLEKFKVDNENFIFLVRLIDEYGDHGIVSLICLKSCDKDVVLLDTFLMSCRILGRHLEAWILSEVVNRIKQNNSRYLITEFIDTKKNSLALNFLNEYGFIKIKKNNAIMKKVDPNLLENKGTLYYFDTEKVKIENLDIYE